MRRRLSRIGRSGSGTTAAKIRCRLSASTWTTIWNGRGISRRDAFEDLESPDAIILDELDPDVGFFGTMGVVTTLEFLQHLLA
jgi:hypothetical protein